ncbi:unnamed protein product [Bursaphelenchus xylophilus]|uniref:(pine wood nematode) hypothetical protein n=1 Tax=Bursaphelenchus xylophilus TaxID=6326 RepID=A0A7I8WY98_BURXY|nr:unnamed protein product [Bursaphelenchus xylophilus]CAG9101045.1 unnamed protein product [Bursaphelenchus xylophilus]
MSARNILDRLPLEIRCKILDKTPLPLVAELIREEVEIFEKRFEEGCRNNFLLPSANIGDGWKDLFMR